MGNWFIAAETDSALLAELYEAFIGFMNSRDFSNQNNLFGRLAVAALGRLLDGNVERTTYWLSPRLQQFVRAYPYLIFHYTFNKIILTNPDLSRLWNQGLALDAVQAHSLRTLARRPDGLDAALTGIENGGWPLQKLDWRFDLASPYWGPVMERLSETLSRHHPAQRAAE
jgi:hypothetical protein